MEEMRKEIDEKKDELREMVEKMKKNGIKIRDNERMKRKKRGFENVKEKDMVEEIRNRNFEVRMEIEKEKIKNKDIEERIVDFEERERKMIDWEWRVEEMVKKN